MISVQPASLPAAINHALEILQSELNLVPTYAERVREASLRFGAQSRPGNAVFDVVRKTLASMCPGATRCMYCEDSIACEVEHLYPKTFYPELVFAWLNYLYSCSLCNRIKGSQFRLFYDPSGYVDLARRRTDPIVEPRTGTRVLIDPRREDPLGYFSLDLKGTFCFLPRHRVGSPEYARASYTIDCLKLNDRDYLLKARQEAYHGYRSRLREYLDHRGTAEGVRLARAITRCGHPTVWAEMKSQSGMIPDIGRLFAAAPEALGW